MLRVDVTGSAALQERMRQLPQRVRDALRAKVYALTLQLETHVKRDKLSGQVLHARTGRLRRSIQHRVVDSGDLLQGYVYSSGDVPYAAIHEFGGRTSPHDIVPVKAQALAFTIGGKLVFARLVHHPGSVIPERSYLRSALADMSDRIETEMARAVREAVR